MLEYSVPTAAFCSAGYWTLGRNAPPAPSGYANKTGPIATQALLKIREGFANSVLLECE